MSYAELECGCSEAHRKATGGAFHENGCAVRERIFAEAEQRKAAEERAAAERRAAARARAASAPKSRHRGRITDHASARKEIEGMARLAQQDERLSPCSLFVYGVITSRGWRHGSVLVMAAADYLSAVSGDTYSVPQCRRALDSLETLGYIEQKPWRYVAKRDPGLFAYAKRSRRDTRGGRWPNAYLIKQDPPGNDDARPDAENPIVEMFGLASLTA